jgi:surface protein
VCPKKSAQPFHSFLYFESGFALIKLGLLPDFLYSIQSILVFKPKSFTNSLASLKETKFMFRGASSYNQDISGWDTSNVTDMSSMFYEANDFNQDIVDWDVSKVTFMNQMFRRAFSFNQPIGDWDVSNVTDMQGMFGFCVCF